MTTKAPTSPHIRPYLDALESKLNGLPTDEHAELLGDLESHLEEILTDESDTTLAERIGTPDAYADEFAASIGLEDEPRPSRSLGEIITGSIRHISNHPATERAQRLWEEMRPAWWTLRGLAIGLFLTWNYLGPGNPDALWAMQFVAGALVLTLIGVSMRIGRNRNRDRTWSWLSIAVTVVGVLTAFALVANISARLDPNYEGGVHYPYGMLTEQDVRFMQENGLTPEQFFDGRYYMNLREGELDPPITTIPSEPGLIAP